MDAVTYVKCKNITFDGVMLIHTSAESLPKAFLLEINSVNVSQSLSFVVSTAKI